MNRQEVVVADTTPLNYLIIIGRMEILASLFGEVLIPEAVLDELRHPKAPVAVSQWLSELPEWVRVTPVHHLDKTLQLGKGENEAISLALELRVKLVLMDERLGRGAAQERGLVPIGTLNLIDLADERGSRMSLRRTECPRHIAGRMTARSVDILSTECRGHSVRRGTACPLHSAVRMTALLVALLQAASIRSAVILTAKCRGHSVRRGTTCPLHSADETSALHIALNLLLAPDEYHGFANPESEMAVYRAIELFLHQHLGGHLGPAPSEAVKMILENFQNYQSKGTP